MTFYIIPGARLNIILLLRTGGVIFTGTFITVRIIGRNSLYLHGPLARLRLARTYYAACLLKKYPVPHRTDGFFINEILMS